MNRKRHLFLFTTRLLSIHSYSTVSNMEKLIPCSDGVQLAALHWTQSDEKATNISKKNHHHHRILCLHGWLDNASSFHVLAPSLIEKISPPSSSSKVDIVAIDHVGHGKSMHKSPDSTMIFTEFVYYVAETMKFLQWDTPRSKDDNPTAAAAAAATATTTTTTTTLIGHSMGAAIALLYTAAFPEQVDRLILLDGIGPASRNSAHIAQHVRDSITKRLSSNPTLFPHLYSSSSADPAIHHSSTSTTRQRVYTSLDSAIEARLSTNYAFQENLYMSREAAHALVHRGTKPFLLRNNKIKNHQDDVDDLDSTTTSSSSSSAVVFSHDQRLKWPSTIYFTKEQTEALHRSITCPTCLIIAKDGYLIQNGEVEITNAQKNIQNLSIEKASGSHHFHMDPDTAEEAVEHVYQFIVNPEEKTVNKSRDE